MPVEFRSTTLDNGLTIVGEIDQDAHTAAAGFFVKTGARDETPDVMGVSHFLEHMMFKGTDQRSGEDVNREFDELGARYNAYTSSEITCFYASVIPDLIDGAVDLLGDMMRPALRDSDFQSERSVILEEIAMYQDNPFWVLYDQLNELRYPTHALGHRVLGTNDTVKALTRDQMNDYFTNRYSADNTTVALAGSLNFDLIVEQIAALCGDWNTTGAKRDNAEPTTASGRLDLRDASAHHAYIAIESPAPAMHDPRRYAAMLLAKALGEPDNSLLHWSLVDKGLAEHAEASYDAHDGGGTFFVYASCPEASAEETLAAMESQIARLPDAVSQDDLSRLRNKIATAVTLAGERPSGRMQRLGRLWTYLGEHLTLEEELARIEAVTLQDIRDICEAFPFQPRTVGILLPAEEDADDDS